MNNGYRERDIALSIIFTIITCGIYGIYWYISVTDESLILSNKQGTGGVLCFILALITCGIYNIYWGYRIGERMDMEKQRRGFYTGNNTGLLYLILNIFGFEIITIALLQNDLNKINRESGMNAEFGNLS